MIEQHDSIYNKENHERLMQCVIKYSEAMEEIVELFGENAAAWRIKRVDSEEVMRVKAVLLRHIDKYIVTLKEIE